VKKLLLISIAALFLATGTAHAAELPERFTGRWCIVSQEVEPRLEVLKRFEEECDSDIGAVTILPNGSEDADLDCKYGNIEQSAQDAYQVYATCEILYEGGGGGTGSFRQYLLEIKIIEGQLIITELTEG
jgi:hypothetical protein